MISTKQLEICLKKSNPDITIYGNPDSAYDVVPAGLHHKQDHLFSVPKGYVPEETIRNSDGSILNRGYKDIIHLLGSLVDSRVVLEAIHKAEAGIPI